MPMGFCAILGGTVTMVGSSPLILLNDLIINANENLADDQQINTFDLFDVTPIGIALILSGILYFVVFGRFVLPKGENRPEPTQATATHLKDSYGIDYDIVEVYVPLDSKLIGQELDSFETEHSVRTVALTSGKNILTGKTGVSPGLEIHGADCMALVGRRDALIDFCEEFDLTLKKDLDIFADILSPTSAGLAEVIIAPTSPLIGESARTIALRVNQGVSALSIIRNDESHHEGDDVRSVPFASGDTLVVFADWDDLHRFHLNNNVVVTTPYPHEEVRSNKVYHAVIFFAIAMGLVLFTDLRLSVALLVGALGIIISGVLEPDEAYSAVSWKTVFLLASLIPLGKAVESSGTATWIADRILNSIGDVDIWVLQLVVAVLATAFTLVMSNVGATVLLVPLAISIAHQVGANPATFALTVALATSNSFLLPTHQVNALIMGPGRYKVPDFLRAGGIMTIIFLVVLITMLQLFY